MVTNSEQKPQVNVRQITEEDIDGVLAIDRAITGSNRAITYTTIPGSFVEADLEISMVAEVSDQIVGFVLGRITESPYGLADIALLELMGINSAYQRHGIGTALVQGFMERCRQKGVKSVHSFISGHDLWLLSFVNSLGFTRGDMIEFIKPIES